MQNKNTILVVDDQSINIDFIVTNFKDKYSMKRIELKSILVHLKTVKKELKY